MVDKSTDQGKMLLTCLITLTGLYVHSQRIFSVNLAGEKKKKKLCHHHIISIICIHIGHSSQPIRRDKLLDQLL